MMTPMKPYDLEDWVDYVRGLRTEEELGAMEEHLARGSDDSAADVRMLERVRDALLDTTTGPPEELSWTAKAIAGVRPPPLPDLPRFSLDLISIHPPPGSPEIRRHAYVGARKLLYQGHRFDLDIWLEDPQGAQASIVMGQVRILGDNDELTPIDSATVFLLEKGEVAASTITNQFGEFHLEASPEGRIDLQVLLREKGRVDLSIPRETF